MRKRWLVFLLLSLLIGRAWGLHLPLILGQQAPCHGQALQGHHASSMPAHAAHLQADAAGHDAAAASTLPFKSSDRFRRTRLAGSAMP